MNGAGKGPEREILIVEDSDIQAAVLKRILAENGYGVTWARNGAEGLEAAGRARPSLIISDVMMPVMDGYSMCIELKKNAELRMIPVLLLTQLAEPEDVIKGLQAGADSYITKPYSADYLLSKIEALFNGDVLVRNLPEEKCVNFIYRGKEYRLFSGRVQTLNFLISTYESAVMQNRELIRTQEELKSVNEGLEEKIRERTSALTREISERKAVEEALRESEERFKAVVESASDAVVCLEPPGRVYLWNRKAAEIFGYTRAEAVGKDLHALIVPERFRLRAYAKLDGFFESGAGGLVGKTIEMTAIRKGGEEFPVELSISAVELRGVWNTVGIIRDISERKRLEGELQQNLSDLRRMNKLMVGRELKMEDLRQEIRTLRARVAELESGKASNTGAG